MDETINWSVVEAQTLREQTVEVLRDALLNEIFAPGEKLIERTLAEWTGVSRTSVREALAQLEAEGLVRRLPGKGMYVTRLTETEIFEIYEARAVVEASIARFFVERATEEHIALLRQSIDEAEATNSSEDARLHARKLDICSEIITLGAGNHVLHQMAALLRGRVTYLRTITSRVASTERRKETMLMLNEIYDALSARDADRAETITRAYIQRSAKFAVFVMNHNNGRVSQTQTN